MLCLWVVNALADDAVNLLLNKFGVFSFPPAAVVFIERIVDGIKVTMSFSDFLSAPYICRDALSYPEQSGDFFL